MMRELLPEIWKNKWKILEGLKNKTFRKEHIEQLAAYRHSICKTCIWNSENQRGVEFNNLPEVIQVAKSEEWITEILSKGDERCLGCSCNINLNDSMKLRSLSSKCPNDFWTEITNADEEAVIKLIIDKNKEVE